ncbi:MAG: hypothetical protein ACHQD7_10065 [Chitinophagales bacterium]
MDVGYGGVYAKTFSKVLLSLNGGAGIDIQNIYRPHGLIRIPVQHWGRPMKIVRQGKNYCRIKGKNPGRPGILTF